MLLNFCEIPHSRHKRHYLASLLWQKAMWLKLMFSHRNMRMVMKRSCHYVRDNPDKKLRKSTRLWPNNIWLVTMNLSPKSMCKTLLFFFPENYSTL